MPAPTIRSTEDEAFHQELERVSLDWCMVYNPTDEDFYIEWNNAQGRPWRYLVPNKNKDIGWGKGKLEVQRYLAIWYCEHMKDKIVNDKGLKEAEKVLAARREKGQPDLTKFEEQTQVWGKTPRTTSEQELSTLYPILFLGISREFGMDYAPANQQNVDIASPSEKALEALKGKKYQAPVDSTENAPKEAPASAPLPSVEELESIMPKHE